MPEKERRSPQEKKALSYARDRRNTYGENNKAARKAIPRNKKTANRSVRRVAKQALMHEDLETVAPPDHKRKWRKVPDDKLGAILEWRDEPPVTTDTMHEWNAHAFNFSAEELAARRLRDRLRRLKKTTK
ncbi:MAG: hypothetical protein AAF714_02525 [Pseudomonadota bacterium]